MDGNWYMESNHEVRDRQFLKLYRKNKNATLKLDKSANPLLISVVGGTAVAAVVAIGEKAFNLNLSPWAITSGFFAGEYLALIPLTKTIYNLFNTEKKMMDIIEKNVGSSLNKADYYELIGNVYYLDRQAYFDAYYDIVNSDSDGYTKKKSRK